MDSPMQELLLRFDEPGRYETPSNFNYRKLDKKIKEVALELEKAFGAPFVLDSYAQDASFLTDLFIPDSLIVEPRSTQRLCYSIRFSNFGYLTTLNFEECYTEATRLGIQEVLERQGFIFIPVHILFEEYTGRFEEFKHIYPDCKPNWYLRYFDYL